MVKRSLIVLSLSSALLLISGCSSSSTMVMQPKVMQQNQYSSYNVEEVVIANNVPSEARQYFKTYLEKTLDEKHQVKGNDLKIKYSFIEFNEGNQFSRWMLGGIGGAGKGVLTVKTEFYDKNDAKIGEIQSKGEVGAGFFGGSFNGTLEKVAEEVSDYAMMNYLAKK